MVFIKGGVFEMGEKGSRDASPVHTVQLNSFWMDATEVTNAQFEAFVKATGYVTTAEQKPDWEEIRKTLPPGTPKPHDSLLVAGSLVFKQLAEGTRIRNLDWWQWLAGASWRHPQGPGSSIEGKENHPVTQVSWFDAMAYCKWADKRLPTEAEWEYAAMGGLKKPSFPWGNNSDATIAASNMNSWNGNFPTSNSLADGYLRAAPVASFPANGYGLYDMAGNVWEWCSDWYSSRWYENQKGSVSTNPRGPDTAFDPDEPSLPKRSIRGGSFLCHDSYCSGYRVARRMKSSPDTGLEHVGFRCVRDAEPAD